MPEPKLIPLGRILRAHGVHGAVLSSFYGRDPSTILAGLPLWLVPPATNGDPAPINVNHGKEVAGGVILKFQGCTTRDAAVLLKGFEIAVNRADLPAPEEEEFYQTDLLNLLAITDTGESLGHVSYLMENGPSLVLVIQNESGKESLVPFTEEFVPKVDLDAGTLVVSAIPGLLD